MHRLVILKSYGRGRKRNHVITGRKWDRTLEHLVRWMVILETIARRTRVKRGIYGIMHAEPGEIRQREVGAICSDVVGARRVKVVIRGRKRRRNHELVRHENISVNFVRAVLHFRNVRRTFGGPFGRS